MFIIANTSRRHWEVRHYIRSTNKNVLVIIPMGTQEEVKNLSPAEQDELIAHLRRFGAIERSEVHRKQKNFEGLVYSTDRPLKEEEYRAGLEEVLDEAQSRAVVEATRSAVAADEAVKKSTRGKRLVGDTNISMEQELGNIKERKRMSVTITPTISQSDKLHMN